MQPTPDWRSMIHDIWFIQRQGLTQVSINLTGRGYAMLRLPGQQFIWMEFKQ